MNILHIFIICRMYRMLHLPDLKKEKSQIENNRAHFISDIGWCMDKVTSRIVICILHAV